MSKFCAKCGCELKDTAKFCRMCGSKVDVIVPEDVLEENVIVTEGVLEENVIPVEEPIVNNENINVPQKALKKAKRMTGKGRLCFILTAIVVFIPAVYYFLDTVIRYHGYGRYYMYRYYPTTTLFNGYFISNLAVKLIFSLFLLLMARKLFYGVGHKKNEDYFCPKCKKVTSHNRYKVCFDCGRDNLVKGISLFLLIIIWVLGVSWSVLEGGDFFNIFHSLIWREFFHDFYRSISSDPNIRLLIYILTQLLYLVLLVAAYFVLILFTNYIYMYPAIVARRNGHQMAAAIFWLNFFFGATIIFWIVFLIWASSASQRQERPSAKSVGAQDDIQARFTQLLTLKEQGIISEEEFERKREEILANI